MRQNIVDILSINKLVSYLGIHICMIRLRHFFLALGRAMRREELRQLDAGRSAHRIQLHVMSVLLDGLVLVSLDQGRCTHVSLLCHVMLRALSLRFMCIFACIPHHSLVS